MSVVAFSEKRPRSAKFGITGRDGFIIAKALAYAIEANGALPEHLQEWSDCEDMKKIFEAMFSKDMREIVSFSARIRFSPDAADLQAQLRAFAAREESKTMSFLTSFSKFLESEAGKKAVDPEITFQNMPRDTALEEFTGHVARLAQMTGKVWPRRFSGTAIEPDTLVKLGVFLLNIADLKSSIVPQATDDLWQSGETMKESK